MSDLSSGACWCDLVLVDGSCPEHGNLQERTAAEIKWRRAYDPEYIAAELRLVMESGDPATATIEMLQGALRFMHAVPLLLALMWACDEKRKIQARGIEERKAHGTRKPSEETFLQLCAYTIAEQKALDAALAAMPERGKS